MYPLKFEPYLREMVWGGEKIAPFKGVKTKRHKIGESWDLSCPGPCLNDSQRLSCRQKPDRSDE